MAVAHGQFGYQISRAATRIEHRRSLRNSKRREQPENVIVTAVDEGAPGCPVLAPGVMLGVIVEVPDGAIASPVMRSCASFGPCRHATPTEVNSRTRDAPALRAVSCDAVTDLKPADFA
jgi:hypothetical protein